MDWKDYSFVIRGKIRRSVVSVLEKPRTPSQIAREIKVNVTHVSRALKELENRDIVECLTPNEKLGKIYQLTDKGKDILKHLNY